MGAPRILMTSFGFADAGGGTAVPREVARELARRGWEVTVFHAAVAPTASRVPYEVREWHQDGIRLVGVHNRPHGLFDLADPLRELDDPPITAAFAEVLARTAPDVVHFHNLHNLGARLLDLPAQHGVPSFFTTHNYWLICPRAYLLTGAGTLCPGPGDGSPCANCTGHPDPAVERRRLTTIRAAAGAGLHRILAVSDAVRRTLLGAGYPPDLIEVLVQAMPQDRAIWETVGRHRRPGRADPDRLTVAFLGSAYWHKGPQLLVEAAQAVPAPLRIKILGEIPARIADALRAADRRGCVELHGAFAPEQIGELLADVDAAVLPSLWWDCAPLAAAECRAAGLPLLVPRLGGLAEVVQEEVDGLSFAGRDAADLARQLDRLARETGLLERLQSGLTAPPAFGEHVDALEARYAAAIAGEPDPVALAAGPDPAAGGRGRPPRVVRWQGEFGAPTSLSIVNDEVSRRLGATLWRVTPAGAELDAPPPHPADLEVRHQWPPDLSPARSGRLAVILPWEFGSVPLRWLEQIRDNVDELWVPSHHVAAMFRDGGIAADRIHVLPNGVDLERFRPAAARPAPAPPSADSPLRFLFVGGLIPRKGPDLLLAAWRAAFAGRDDVVLVVKDFGADGIYANANRGPLLEHAASGALPRIELHQETLGPAELVELYRNAEVLVSPYRGEGFAMPVLEAMACGLAIIATAGGPTDEFCPPEAGWRIPAVRRAWPPALLPAALAPVGTPWMLEPDLDALIGLLRAAAADPVECRRRGERAAAAACAWSWDRVAEAYAARVAALTADPPAPAPAPAPVPGHDRPLTVVADPAWRGADELAALLARWGRTRPGAGDRLVLRAEPGLSGEPAALEAHVLAAAARAGVDLERCGDIDVQLSAGRSGSAASPGDLYVPLHPGCAGRARLAAAAGARVVAVDDLERHLPAPALPA